MKLILDSSLVEALLERAATASRLVGYVDARAACAVIEPLADSIDEIVHVLSELLGNPDVVARVPSARSSFAVEVDAQDDHVVRGGSGSDLVVLGDVP